MEPIVLTREVRCRVAREVMWPALAATQRFSRALGGGVVVAEPVSDAGAARFLSTTRLGGMDITYEERPFQWRAPERLVITRPMRNGPGRRYQLGFRLTADGAGSVIELSLSVEPRSLLLWPIMQVQARMTVSRMVRLLGRIDANLAAGRLPYDDLAAQPRHDEAALRRASELLVGALTPALAPLGRRLVDEVAGRPDIDAARLRPYELAAAWGAERRAVLAVCLQAVQAGLVELQWEMVCPSCRIAVRSVAELRELEATVHCQLCDLTSAIDFDRAVEVTLRPAPAVRAVDGGPFCISGPFLMPHVIEQVVLPAGGAATLRAPAEAGRYRVFARGGASASLEVRAGGDAEASLRAGAALSPGELALAPGAALEVRDELALERHLKLEHLEWASLAATAHEVATLPEFRRLFSSQVLRPGLMLQVARMTILFTDLSGSTGLYARVGDALAYRYIHDHFEVLRGVIEREGGVVVKTLGDSIMAAFHDEARALGAAAAMQRAHAAPAGRDDGAVGLKIGVFSGPCYAVTENRLLDYFGQTVNIAQRLEALAESGDLIVPAELARGDWLAGAQVQPFTATLKGIDRTLDLARVRLD